MGLFDKGEKEPEEPLNGSEEDSRKKTVKLSWREGYQAAYGFLDSIWQGVTGEDQELLAELDAFLGGMMLQEEETAADPAILDLWHAAVARITQGGGWGDLTGEEAYQAMVLFLELWARDNSDGTVLGIWEDLSRSGPGREDWAAAVRQVLNGAFDPYFGLTGEEDQTQAIRATLIYLVNGDLVLTKKPYSHWREIEAEYVGYQTSLKSLTYKEIIDFFIHDCGEEENWPIYKEDIQEFFETDQETVRFVKE